MRKKSPAKAAKVAKQKASDKIRGPAFHSLFGGSLNRKSLSNLGGLGVRRTGFDRMVPAKQPVRLVQLTRRWW